MTKSRLSASKSLREPNVRENMKKILITATAFAASMTLRIFVDEPGRVPTDLEVLEFPMTLVVDREGREIGR